MEFWRHRQIRPQRAKAEPDKRDLRRCGLRKMKSAACPRARTRRPADLAGVASRFLRRRNPFRNVVFGASLALRRIPHGSGHQVCLVARQAWRGYRILAAGCAARCERAEPPIWIADGAEIGEAAKSKGAIAKVRDQRALQRGPKLAKATNSIDTIARPEGCQFRASCQGTPISSTAEHPAETGLQTFGNPAM